MVFHSSPETEYIALTYVIREAPWLSKVKGPLMLNKDLTVISADNQGCLNLPKENALNDGTKHINFKYQMILDCVKRGMAYLEYVLSQDNIARHIYKGTRKSSFFKTSSKTRWSHKSYIHFLRRRVDT